MKKKKVKLNPLINQHVVIYDHTPTFIDGAIALIIDRDPKDNSFLAIDIANIRPNMDVAEMYNHAKWVGTDNFKVIKRSRPKIKYLEYIIPAVTLVIGLGLGWMLN